MFWSVEALGETKIKKKLCVDHRQFWSSAGLWFCGILLNMLPIAYKVLNVWLSSSEEIDWLLLFWGDVDFLCVNFSVAFLLFLELFFLKNDKKIINRVLGGILISVTLVLIIAYTVACFSSGWNSRVPAGFMRSANFYMLLFIVGLGIVYFFISATHFRKEVVN